MMSKQNITTDLSTEVYTDIYVDPLEIIETCIDDDRKPCDRGANKVEEESNYDSLTLERKDYTPTIVKYDTSPTSRLSTNQKAAIIAAIMLVLMVVTVFITRATEEPRCPEGWIRIANKSCFKFLPLACEDGCSYKKAQEICQKKGGKLAEPREEKSMEELIEIAKDSKKLSTRNFWIGLEFQNKKRQFQWVSDQAAATIPDKLWHNGHPSYDGSHVHMMMGNMLLSDVGEEEVYKPVCQKTKNGNCAPGWTDPGSQSGFCYNFLDQECLDGCDWDDAGEVCEDNDSYLAEGPDFEFLTKFGKLLKHDVNWWIGITYNHSADIFVRESDGAEVDLSSVYTKEESRGKPIENNTEAKDTNWYPDIEFKYEYDYPEELEYLFDPYENKASDEGLEQETSCLELSAKAGWQIKEGNCFRKFTKDFIIQPLCQL
eukprot:GFUD01014600.1.p1 GENE.GFUD01014600.1~~GFUD01014600.1.p1  ORF type:complete len:430 (+),score=111.55 GFUD01014600.1:13-1302(+)